MKTAIHPKYFEEVKIQCSCGNVVIAGSTKEGLKTELCSKCHPFYTGQQKLVDTAGRVDKFQEKRKRTMELKEAAAARQEAKKKKPVAYQEKEVPVEVLARAMSGAKAKTGKWEAPLGDTPPELAEKEEAAAAEKPKKKAVRKKARVAKKAKK